MSAGESGFRVLAWLTACLFIGLAGLWLLAPDAMLTAWDVDLTGSTGLLGRRLAGLYAGIGVMCLLARKAAPSPARSALVGGLLTTCLLLAALGIFEWLGAHAGIGMLGAVLIELGLALGFVFIGSASNQKWFGVSK